MNFIEKRSEGVPANLNVIEVGSGSSALLYALAQKNLLKYGLGIELSKTRFDFAELWKSDDGYHTVENLNRNFADIDLPQLTFDWFIAIDNFFTYLDPENSAYPEQLLQCAFKALRRGGRILLDFFNFFIHL